MWCWHYPSHALQGLGVEKGKYNLYPHSVEERFLVLNCPTSLRLRCNEPIYAANSAKTPPPPVIRMVYALAAKESVVCVSTPGTQTQLSRKGESKAKFQKNTSFDIWCGQASSKTFRSIQREDDEVYEKLLRLSRDVPNMFNPNEKSLKDLAQSMYPLGTPEPGHWKSFCEGMVID